MKPRFLALGGGVVLVLGSLAGMWASAGQAEQRERDRADAALARSAAAFLSVVVPPGPANGYDPARLLASVNNLARASFWPGGFQLALGSVPLLPDTIGLIPVPDSLLRRLDEDRAPVVVRHAAVRAALVPFLDRDRFGMLGWAAAWETVPDSVPSPSAMTLSVLTVVGLLLLLVVQWRPSLMQRRLPLFVAAGAVLILLAVDLRSSVQQTMADAAALRVMTLKRLIEVAATAPGVRQAMLPEIAVGVRVRPVTDTAASTGAVRTDKVTGEVLAVAATPRTGGSLELALLPEQEGRRRLDRFLALLMGTGLLGLLLMAATMRYSSGTTGNTPLGTA
ncbi:MAG TPA: hypothetical protein VLD58_13130 [Gemmatimonadales bacterium]|nr:hypothetical protein [Gemmatimonadales bacterium]